MTSENQPDAKARPSRRNWLKTGSSAAVLGSSILTGTSGVLNAQNPSRQNPVRMMYNENPVTASDKVRAAMQSALDGEIHTYSYFRALAELKNKLAKVNGVSPRQIIVGAGSTEVLRVTALHLLNSLPEKERIIVANSPGYEGMNQYASNLGASIQRVPVLEKDLSPDLDKITSAVEQGSAILNLCNPNNPTGVVAEEKVLAPFCKKMAEQTFVFVDEAYHEFVTNPNYGSMLPLVKQGLPVMVTRTFSKLFGLAGIRIGYGIGPVDLVAKLNRLQTGTINIVAIRAAMAALEDEEFQQRSLANNVEAKAIVTKELQDMARKFTVGEGNFLFFHTGMPIRQFYNAMMEKGFQVGRPFPPYLDWCRLSMAKPEQMKQFCTALREVLA